MLALVNYNAYWPFIWSFVLNDVFYLLGKIKSNAVLNLSKFCYSTSLT